MVVLRGLVWKLDDRGCAIEYFATTVEDKMIVRRDLAKCYCEGRAEFLGG